MESNNTDMPVGQVTDLSSPGNTQNTNKPAKSGKTMTFVALAVAVVALVAVGGYFALKPKPVTKTAAAATKLTKVNVKLKWVHNAQFAGMYYAKEHGYYKAAGLDVTLEPWTEAAQSATKAVSSGTSQFAVSSGTDIIAHRANKGRNTVGIATIFQHDPEGYVALKSSGITTIKDIAGKKVGLFSGKNTYIFNAILRNQSLTGTKFNLVTMDTVTLPKNEMDVLINKTVDVYSTFLTDQAIRLQNQLKAANSTDSVVTFNPYDYGISNYNDTLITSEDMIKNNPAEVQAFVNATIKGWHDAIKDPAGAVDAIHKYDGTDYKAYEADIFKAEVPFVQTTDAPLLWTDGAVWNNMYQLLNLNGALTTQFEVAKAFDTQFVRTYYNAN